MENPIFQLRYAHANKIIKQTAKDLLSKNLIPQHTKGAFMDVTAIKQATLNYMKEPIKSYTCPVCMLTIKCPRAWIRQHVKSHERRPEERKENETFESRVNPYFY